VTWSKFDDGYDQNEKIEDAWYENPATIGLHVMATTHCARHGSNGVIRPRWLADKIPSVKERARVVETLVRHGLFELLPAGAITMLADRDGELTEVGPFPDERYVVHDFLKYNDSVAKRERLRDWDRRRKELERDRALVAAIRERDQERCRYCGTLVNWRDRRGPRGGTYDHVTPRGDNSLENVVVACRGCSQRKRDRTPEQAEMSLLPAGSIDTSGSGPRIGNGQVSARTESASSRLRPVLPDPTRPDPTRPPPTPPVGGRERDRVLFEEQLRAWAAAAIPDLDAEEVVGAVNLMRASKRPDRDITLDGIRALVARRSGVVS
jgi:hypothetical protein